MSERCSQCLHRLFHAPEPAVPPFEEAVAAAEAYVVEGAGVEAANGIFWQRKDEMNGVPCYENDWGVLLLRYCMKDNVYWYLSDSAANLNTDAGDYYRIQSAAPAPPLEGAWAVCRVGHLPAPSLAVYDAVAAKAAAQATVAEVAPCLTLTVVLLSGKLLGKVAVDPSWTGAQVKTALDEYLEEGTLVTWLMAGSRVFEDNLTVADLGLQSGATLNAIIRLCDFMVEDAGAPRVNGRYVMTDTEVNQAPTYKNEVGTLLFRYRFAQSGSTFWYFSDDSQDLSQPSGDYYRVKTTDLAPPTEGWETAKCPLAQHPCPRLRPPPTPGEACTSIRVALSSGGLLSDVAVAPTWTGSKVKAALGRYLQEGTLVTRITVGTQVFEDDQSVADLGLQSGATVNAVIRACDFIVEGAGSSCVNGRYAKTGQEIFGAPTYRNDSGMLLLRYQFAQSGSSFWYFSDESKDPMTPIGDYYRVKTTALSPPAGNWSAAKCPLGRHPCPRVRQPLPCR